MTRIALILGIAAALSVTVMVAPVASAQNAPPWATGEPAPCVLPPVAGTLPPTNPLSASLSITPVVGGNQVVISGVLRASSVAEAYQLYKYGSRAEYTLWGDDPDEDDRLGPDQYISRQYVVQGDACEGRVYFSSSRFYKSADGGWGYLDEDKYPPDGNGTSFANRDEVYAEVRFKNHRVETNTVYGFF